jgi:hypothetical protein
MLQIGSDQAWLWIAVEPIHRLYASLDNNSESICSAFLLLGRRRRFLMPYEILLNVSSLLLRLLPIFVP